MNDTVRKLRERVLTANLDLVKYGLVVSTWGNVSGYDPELGVVAIKASGVAYDDMGVEHMVVVDLDGTVLEGDYRPSTDTPTHLALYKLYGAHGIRGVVHTHSKYATVWTQAMRDIPALGTTHVDYFDGPIPCTRELTPTEVAEGYEAAQAVAIEEAVSPDRCTRMQAILLAHHAPFAWGTSPDAAVTNAQVLEYVAEMAYLESTLVGGTPDVLPAHMHHKHRDRKFGPDAYYGQANR